MKASRIPFAGLFLLLGVDATPGFAQVFASEFAADPVSEGWTLIQRYCEPVLWSHAGVYHQEVSLDACPPGPGGGRDVYRRSLDAFVGPDQFFIEFCVTTDGDRSEIPGGAPTVLVVANDIGVGYHLTVAGDLMQFFRAADLPVLLIEIEPGVPHVYRVEHTPDQYAFFIDADLIDEGLPDGPFLTRDPRISWQGRSWYLPCHNAWDFIRYGRIPDDASGDYDSDEAVDLFDYYFVHDCLTKDGPGIFAGPEQNAGPGCRFTDFDADSDADLLDFAEFQNAFTAD